MMIRSIVDFGTPIIELDPIIELNPIIELDPIMESIVEPNY